MQFRSMFISLTMAAAMVVPSFASDTDGVFLHVNSEQLFATAGMQIVHHIVSAKGVAYELKGHPTLKHVRVKLSVHPAAGVNHSFSEHNDVQVLDFGRENGSAVLFFGSCRTSISGMPTPCDVEIGDERILWSSESFLLSSGRIIECRKSNGEVTGAVTVTLRTG